MSITKTHVLTCDECGTTTTWVPDGVNVGPPGWTTTWVDICSCSEGCECGTEVWCPDCAEAVCPEHGSFCPGLGICDWQSGTGKYQEATFASLDEDPQDDDDGMILVAGQLYDAESGELVEDEA